VYNTCVILEHVNVVGPGNFKLIWVGITPKMCSKSNSLICVLVVEKQMIKKHIRLIEQARY